MKTKHFFAALAAIALLCCSCAEETEKIPFYLLNNTTTPLVIERALDEATLDEIPRLQKPVVYSLLPQQSYRMTYWLCTQDDKYLVPLTLLIEGWTITSDYNGKTFLHVLDNDSTRIYHISEEDADSFYWLRNYIWDNELNGYLFIIDDDYLEHVRNTAPVHIPNPSEPQ